MRTKFLQGIYVLALLILILSSCVAQKKTGCAPERMRKETKFKGFLWSRPISPYCAANKQPMF